MTVMVFQKSDTTDDVNYTYLSSDKKVIAWKKIAEELFDLLVMEKEQEFDRLYELGEVSDNGKNYDDARNEWVEEYLHYNIKTLNSRELDEFEHGELD